MCGFSERRIDGKMPLRLVFLDDNPQNFARDNLNARCYNCVFLTQGITEADYHTIDAAEDDMEQVDLSEEEIQALQDEALDGMNTQP